MDNQKLKICIIGFGRFGQLMHEILKPFGDLFIISRNQINKDGINEINIEGLKDIDWIIPTVPISALENTLQKINPYLKDNAIVMDVSSVKTLPCQWLKENISENVEIIGTHPMFGPDSAKQGLEGLQMVICPLRISEKSLDTLKSIFEELKLKVIETSPEDHDQETAKSLALVHYLGRGLTNIPVGKQKITTLGFERLLAVNETVENDTWELFVDMQKYNPYTEEIRKKIVAELVKIEDQLKEEGV